MKHHINMNTSCVCAPLFPFLKAAGYSACWLGARTPAVVPREGRSASPSAKPAEQGRQPPLREFPRQAVDRALSEPGHHAPNQNREIPRSKADQHSCIKPAKAEGPPRPGQAAEQALHKSNGAPPNLPKAPGTELSVKAEGPAFSSCPVRTLSENL